ncbi:MAG: glycoside hydrolase family 25 protein [Oscillospiraceae bacterium]
MSINKKLLKNSTAALLAAAMLACVSAAGFAEASPEAAGNETVIIEALPEYSDDSEADAPPGSISPEETGDHKPDSGVDLTDTDYTPVDLTGYEQWNGKTKLNPDTDYYITGKVKLSKSFALPQGSRLVLTEGSELLMYKGYKLNVKGSLLVEKGATLTMSGTISVFGGGSLESYGTIAATKSSVVNIMSEYIIRSGTKATYSGRVNIYKDGLYLNYGTTAFTANSEVVVTGEFQNPVGGRLLSKGKISISISGRTTQAGMFSLSGTVVNSGLFVFESTAKYYKSKQAKFAVSKSSRLIDYRYNNGNYRPGDEDSEIVTDSGIKGIDVSYAQGAVDWASVKASGVEFAMIRASRGRVSDKKPMAADTTFEYNITEATKYGLHVGVYHYLYASTVSEARKEAQFLIKTISPYRIDYPVVLDVEEQYQADLGRKKLTNIVKAFLDEIKAAGYYGMLYSNKTWLTKYIDMSQISEYDVWLAQWNSVPTYDGPFGMWQYSSKGIVSGIDGYVDLNISYKRYNILLKKEGWNHL